MGKQIDEILNDCLNQVNNTWFEKKKNEFMASYLWEKEDNVHHFSILNIYQLREEIIDDEGRVSDGEIIKEEEFKIEFTNTFREYCKLQLNLFENDTYEVEMTIKNYKGITPITFGLTEITNQIADNLGEFLSDVPHASISDFINNIYDLSIELINISKEVKDSAHLELERDLAIMIRMELEMRNCIKLESAKYLKTHWNKLKFKLNAEDFSALMVILQNSRIIFEEKKDILDFSSRHFLNMPQGKTDFTRINSITLSNAMENHGTPGHMGKGISNILERISKTVNKLEKPR